MKRELLWILVLTSLFLLKAPAQSQVGCVPVGTGFVYHVLTCQTATNFTYNSSTQQVSLMQNLANTALALYRYSDSSPSGFLIQAQNHAGTSNLFTVDALGSVTATNATLQGPAADVRWYGAVANGQRASGCSWPVGLPPVTVTCASGTFSSGDVGKAINLGKAGASGCGGAGTCPVLTTIASFSGGSGTQVTVAAATTTAASSNGWIVWGTDNTAAIQAAIDYSAYANVEHTIYFPRGLAGGSSSGTYGTFGCYATTATLQLPNTGYATATYSAFKGDGLAESTICNLNNAVPTVTIQDVIGSIGTGFQFSNIGFFGPPNYADYSAPAIQAQYMIGIWMDHVWINGHKYGVDMANSGSTSSQLLVVSSSIFEEGLSAVYWHGGTDGTANTLIFDNNVMDQYTNSFYGGWVLDLYNLTGITISNNSFGPGIGQGIKCDTCQSFEIHHNDFSQATVSPGTWGLQQVYLVNSSSGVVDGNSFQASLTEDSDLAGNNTGIAWHDNVHKQPSTMPAIVFSGSGNSVNMHDEVIASAAASGGAIRIPVSSINDATVSGTWCAPSVADCVVTSGGTVPSGSYIATNRQAIAVGAAITSATNTDLAGVLLASGNHATFAFHGSYTTHPVCTATDETTVSSAIKVSYTGTTSVTFTTPGSADTVDYVCIGRN